MSYEVNRASQLRQGLAEFKERAQLKGKKSRSKLQIGDFVFDGADVKKRHIQALKILGQNYKEDMVASSLGFEMGASSIVDILIGAKHCFLETKGTDKLVQQKCLYILLCRFANVYVIGQHSYFDNNAHALPGIETVDNFQSKKLKDLACSVAMIMEASGCERVYAAELDGSLPRGIAIESNLVFGEPVLFDGYFWWID